MLTVEEVENYYASDITTPLGMRDRAMLELLYATGMRVSRLIISVENINLEMDFLVSVRVPKRIVPIGDIAVDYIKIILPMQEKILNGKESNMLFLNCDGNGLTRQGF